MIRFLVVLSALLLCEIAPATEPARPQSNDLDLIVLDDGQLLRARLAVEVDGRPLARIWDETFKRLFQFVDRDSDGRLTAAEVKLLPAPIALRQALGNGFIPPVGSAPELAEIDGNSDERITLTEMATFYRNAGIGNVLIGVGRLPHTKALTTTLLKLVDSNADGRTTEKEWAAAGQALIKLDKNGDRLLGVGELVPGAIYPGGAGSSLLRPPSKGKSPSPVIRELPLLQLPTDAKDTEWATVLVQRLDSDGDKALSSKEAGLSPAIFRRLDRDSNDTLSPSELSEWRQDKPTARWVIHVGAKPETVRGFTHRGKRLIVDNWINAGKMSTAWEVARTTVLAGLASSASGEEKESPSRLAWLVPIADHNGDGKLDRKEVDAWLELQEQVQRGQVLLTLLNGGGLFEALDVNHDGALSQPELRGAWQRLASIGCIHQGALLPARAPHVLLAPVSHGYLGKFGLASTPGPEWFQAMDRNRDGVVTKAEFIGRQKQFDALDSNGDGWIDVAEAAKFSPKKK